MDDRAFDRWTQLLGDARSRRRALQALLGTAIVGLAGSDVEARKHKGRGRVKSKRKGKNRRRQVSAQALPARCCNSGDCEPGQGKDLEKCCYSGSLAGQDFSGANLGAANLAGVDASGANFGGANLKGACLTGANLSEANLQGAVTKNAIFCHTTMPDGSENNDGCDRITRCCPTCPGDCPPDPRTGDPGFCCPGGICSCGGQCCAGPDCWIFTPSSPDGETIPPSRELCDPPEGCVFCPATGTQCCTACVGPNLECASSGPISGGTIRRR